MIENLKLIKEGTKLEYEKLLKHYSEYLENDFGLSNEEKTELDDLFNRSYQSVLEKLLISYSSKMSKNVGKKTDYTAETPVIAKKSFSNAERQYLVSLYLDKIDEYSFEEIGFQSIKIYKKFCCSDKLEPSIIVKVSENDKDYWYSKECYFLELNFSPRKDYSKNNRQKVNKR